MAAQALKPFQFVVGFGFLRRLYASVLIRGGESVKIVQERLGHTSGQTTLDVYGHLWPEDDDRTTAAVEAVLGGLVSPVCHIDDAEDKTVSVPAALLGQGS